MKRRPSLIALALLCVATATSTWASSTDFTVQGTGDDAVDLPYPLTAGTWFYTITYQTDDDDAPDFYLESVDLSCDGSRSEGLAASARNKRLTVGAYPANVCAGWHEVDPIDYQLRSWSIQFTKEEPPVDEEPPCIAAGEGLNLSGYHVFMCIVRGAEVIQLPTYELSSKSAILGSRSDPKATIKIVSGCQWGAVAAVTTARPSQIRVYNTANGKEWTHNHHRGGLAPSGYSGDALCD